MSTRVPPHDLDAEQALLGALLLSPKAVDAVAGSLTPEDFYKPAHGHAYAAIVEVHTAAETVDVVTITATLGARGLADETTGAYLTTLVAEVGSTTAAPTYARIVTEHARRRRMLGLAGELAEAAYAGDEAGMSAALEQALAMPEVGRARIEIEDLTAAVEGDEPAIVPTILEMT